MGKSHVEVYSWENQLYWIFQQAMFDYLRVLLRTFWLI
jgi:hypothetical protein